MKRAAVELAHDWWTDRVLRRLETLMLVADAHDLLLITGSGEVTEPAKMNGAASLPSVRVKPMPSLPSFIVTFTLEKSINDEPKGCSYQIPNDQFR